MGKIIKERGYTCCELYKKQSNFFVRSLRRLFNKLRFPKKDIWYNKKILKCGARKIIIHEPLCTVDYVEWLRKKKPDADIVFWYWNYVKNTINPDKIKSDICRKWSFSRVDCKKYGMRFNPLPYFTEIKSPEKTAKYDVVFVGKDKGRLAALLDLRKQLNDMGLTTKFVITPSHSYDKNPEYSKPISYMESVAVSAEGRAVLDYIEVTDSGQSLRVIEALFLKEKIITNSVLVYDYDFYRPENIFVLGKDDLSKLPEFLATPYKEIDKEIIMRYDFDSVIERFFTDEPTVFDGMMEKI
jgi:hypothetical protein